MIQSAILLVIMMAAVYAYAPPERKVFRLSLSRLSSSSLVSP
jgi:hypothetical protein